MTTAISENPILRAIATIKEKFCRLKIARDVRRRSFAVDVDSRRFQAYRWGLRGR